MKKTKVKCPVCGIEFDPRIPFKHINEHHQHASDHELARIRDARRSCYGQPKPARQVSASLRPSSMIIKRHQIKKITAR
ncbi:MULTISPECIES: hypothetical protein [unclassified Pantoea]|uniref:hypothetical protein n=1 Tax=unclassified Pantoea TaxID=2630326 RepID=UPI001CD27378|nr:MULTISPECIES: hypothetical protein [unclassified Pantoea]MCA1176675.1 hypothetical protein [Pantoea sp. alder69]MCA1251588.1 hypothetical protein [Pantoea sp. alder70]MCA1264281.1 hypothetical protein [Pantoea sp. alder81]